MIPVLEKIGLLLNGLTPPGLFWCIAAAVLVFLWQKRQRAEASLFAAALVATTAAVELTKIAFSVPRPEDALLALESYAFPSGHAAASMFLAVMGSWLYRRLHGAHLPIVSAALFALAILVGCSRILIHVHTAPQVLAGFAYGIAIPLACTMLAQRYGRLK